MGLIDEMSETQERTVGSRLGERMRKNRAVPFIDKPFIDGLRKKRTRLLIKALAALFFFLSGLFPVFSEETVSAPAETVSLSEGISRLEEISRSADTREKYGAFTALARLRRLAGDAEAALKTCETALAAFPEDGRFLLEEARLFISLGEHEKAAGVLRRAGSGARDRNMLIQVRYLSALLEAFSSSNVRPLAAIAEDDDFSVYRSGVFYTLWKITGLVLWKNRLAASCPQSPETKIAAAAAGVESAPAPLWLLFAGVEEGEPAGVPVSSPAGAAAPVPENFLQAGLFGREENAAAFADRLKDAGFEPRVVKRRVNGGEMLAVGVNGGGDINAVIRKLKEAGFESFPVKL